MVQFARPAAIIFHQGYTDEDSAAPTATKINEAVADDNSFLQSALAPASAVLVWKFGAVVDPVSSAGHTFRYRYGKDATLGDQLDQTFQLRQGYVDEGTPGTLIAAQAHTNVGVGPIAGSLALSGAEADAITDYSDLFGRLVSNAP